MLGGLKGLQGIRNRMRHVGCVRGVRKVCKFAGRCSICREERGGMRRVATATSNLVGGGAVQYSSCDGHGARDRAHVTEHTCVLYLAGGGVCGCVTCAFSSLSHGTHPCVARLGARPHRPAGLPRGRAGVTLLRLEPTGRGAARLARLETERAASLPLPFPYTDIDPVSNAPPPTTPRASARHAAHRSRRIIPPLLHVRHRPARVTRPPSA